MKEDANYKSTKGIGELVIKGNVMGVCVATKEVVDYCFEAANLTRRLFWLGNEGTMAMS